MSIKISKKNSVKVNVVCQVPSDKRAGYDKKTFTAEIKKLYGDEKKQFMDDVMSMKDIDIIREAVTEVSKLEWFATREDGEPSTFKGEMLQQLLEALEENPVDYVVGPLARECLNVQDEGYRRVLEAKN